MIAMKREVAALELHVRAGFPWSECQVRKLATSHCTIYFTIYDCKIGKLETQCVVLCRSHTEEWNSHRLSYKLFNVRKGGGFFYGKSSNENHTEGV